MTKPQSPPFKCPNCEALYQVERIEAAPANDREIACRSCGGPLPSREGQFILKYFLLRRSGDLGGARIASCERHDARAKIALGATVLAPSPSPRAPMPPSVGAHSLFLSYADERRRDSITGVVDCGTVADFCLCPGGVPKITRNIARSDVATAV